MERLPIVLWYSLANLVHKTTLFRNWICKCKCKIFLICLVSVFALPKEKVIGGGWVRWRWYFMTGIYINPCINEDFVSDHYSLQLSQPRRWLLLRPCGRVGRMEPGRGVCVQRRRCLHWLQGSHHWRQLRTLPRRVLQDGGSPARVSCTVHWYDFPLNELSGHMISFEKNNC